MTQNEAITQLREDWALTQQRQADSINDLGTMRNSLEDLTSMMDTALEDVEDDLRHTNREFAMSLADLGTWGRSDLDPTLPADAATDPDSGVHTAPRTMIVTKTLQRAEAEWNLNIAEPPLTGKERIDHYIRSLEGAGWTWEKPYAKNGQYAWCGTFVGFCLSAAGLKSAIRKKVMPSCWRLWSSWKDTARYIPLDQIHPGDIVVVGTPTGKAEGNHVTLCSLVGDGFIETWEGNAKGPGPMVTHEGVIRRQRPMNDPSLHSKTYRVKHAYRPLLGDFEATA